MTNPRLLNFTSYGEGSGIPFLIVHGLFGSGRNWRAIARHLSKDQPVVTVDLRNHGHSFWDDDNSYLALASDLKNVISELGGRVNILGHSMGGKAAMVLALQNPQMVNRLIIADIAPIKYHHTQRENIAIMQSVPLENFDRRSAVQSALEDKTGDAALSAFLAQSVEVDGGNLRWMLNLDSLNQNMGPIIGFPEMDGAYDREALFIRGANSTYVNETGKTAITCLFPCAKILTIDGAGHWLHAEKTKEFTIILGEYLAS